MSHREQDKTYYDHFTDAVSGALEGASVNLDDTADTPLKTTSMGGEELLQDILGELKKMNTYLAMMNNIRID